MRTFPSRQVAAAIADMKHNVVMFDRFKTTFDRICEVIELYRETGVAENFLVLGASGCGKSTLCNLIQATYPSFSETEREVVPILYLEIPALATISSLVEGLLGVLQDPAPGSGTITDKTNRLALLVKGCGVLTILLDEMQHVHDRGQTLTISRVADWIKSLTGCVGCPIILVGLPRTRALLDANEQLRRRFSSTLVLERFELRNKEETLEFAKTVKSFLSASPFVSRLETTKADDLRSLYYASDGRVGYLVTLLIRALLMADRETQPVLDRPLFERAFKAAIWKECPRECNPFSNAFEERRLNDFGEPFHESVIIKGTSKASRKIER
ncbi:TniB family NTP-binding protein [Ralstonia chuxiongensis]|uniref:TniB family NTP-binding protein n=1 Tax=Ralstonia chuxiongensis TaxID=2957504 RepID=UPI0028F5A20B|nr:TniB family NTP-binding protein [Ralstonia chuxiongensis]CAJ0772851.1 hypothetical protein R8510_03037 [Ralstonia chuxiongensis]